MRTNLKPHLLATYAYELAGNFSNFYVNTPKLLEEQDIPLRTFRIELVRKTAFTLKKAFELLGIEMPDKM